MCCDDVISFLFSKSILSQCCVLDKYDKYTVIKWSLRSIIIVKIIYHLYMHIYREYLWYNIEQEAKRAKRVIIYLIE